MKRRILGMFFLMAVAAMFVACGDSSSSPTNQDAVDDECTKDPNAPTCVVGE